jgi:hypothetical protein
LMTANTCLAIRAIHRLCRNWLQNFAGFIRLCPSTAGKAVHYRAAASLPSAKMRTHENN